MELKIDYICALTNLYGHVSPKRTCKVYNQHSDENLKPKDFEVFLENPGLLIEDRYVYIKEGRFIEETLYLFEGKYEKLRAKQKGKPYYIPEKTEVKEYAKFTYWEQPLEYKELETYISTHFFPDQEETGKKLADEIFHHMMENNFDGSLELLFYYEIVLSEDKESDPFLYIMQRLCNNTRMRAHNGHTPIELSKLMDEPVYIVPDKVLEDDSDCHCGSKKKYTDCHKDEDDKIRRLKDYRSDSE